jgi:shikimate kinase
VAQVVVLLGPPGSGKSAVGYTLDGLGYRWRDWEWELVRTWGSRAAFLRNKSEALPELHQGVLDWLAASGRRAAWETTGLSDAPLLEQIRRDHDATVVRLDVSVDTALARVRRRRRGSHLSDDPEDTRRVVEAFQRLVLPHQPVDLVVDTEGQPVEATAAMIVERVPKT